MRWYLQGWWAQVDSNNRADEMSISASSSVCGYIWIHGTSELQGPREIVQSSLPLTETSVHETADFSVKLHHPLPSQLLHMSNIPVTCCALSELGKALFFGPGTLNLYLINSYYNLVMNAHLSSFYSCENWGLEMLSNLSKVTQLVNGIQPNSVWIWSPCSFLHDFTTLKKKCLFSASLVPLFCITFAMDWMMPSQNVYVEALTFHMIVFEDGPSGGI